MNTDICKVTAQRTIEEWHQPSPRVGSGHDARSSSNGLLSIFYGSLEHAAHYQWLNAGRTLVDKTYLNILWQAAELAHNGYDFTNMASNLDAFVRAQLEPIWYELDLLSHEEKQQQAIKLIQQAAAEVFGSGYHEQHAAWLLFYLCPQLPVFPFNAALQTRISTRLHQPQSATNYLEYQQQCRQLYSRMLPLIQDFNASVEYGNEQERKTVSKVLRGSDWWQRYCFIKQLLA
ncbi:hypothetical protein [Amphritea sp.]|uniref:hypothetical protein n=1 Tax=Amphritea sp. TaxID=1872502 RepID=UPI003A908120